MPNPSGVSARASRMVFQRGAGQIHKALAHDTNRYGSMNTSSSVYGWASLNYSASRGDHEPFSWAQPRVTHVPSRVGRSLAAAVGTIALAVLGAAFSEPVLHWIECRRTAGCTTTLLVERVGEPGFVSPGGLWAVKLRVENTGNVPTEGCVVYPEAGSRPREFVLAPGQSKVLKGDGSGLWLEADPPERPRSFESADPRPGDVVIQIACENVADPPTRLFIGYTDI